MSLVPNLRSGEESIVSLVPNICGAARNRSASAGRFRTSAVQ